MISSSISPSPSGSGTVRSSSLHALPSHLPYPSETGALRALRYATRALRAIRNGGECKVNGQRQEPHEPTEVANEGAGWQEHRESIPPIDLTSLVLLSPPLLGLVRRSFTRSLPSHSPAERLRPKGAGSRVTSVAREAATIRSE